MPRPKSNQPAYQYHVSGQAFVTLDSKRFYLGKHGTPESYARYYALLAEYNANGKKAPGKDTAKAERMENTAILIKNVTADFRARKLPKYEGNKSEHNRFDNLLKLLDKRYANDPADTFGPRKLEELREHILKHGIGELGTPASRRYANDLTRMIVAIIKHGVRRELVAPTHIEALRCLEPLKRGEAPDNPRRTAAPLEAVQATLPHLSEVVAAMVRIQLATAMRPSELFSMTPAMIDRAGDVWFYRPTAHKTAHHGKAKAVPILGDALEALTPFLFGDPDAPCFTTPNGTRWNKNTYRRHITRACEDNDLVRWTPYQLRHTAAQAVRDAAGPEAAQALLGHSRLDTTEIYAKASEAKAVEAARVTPRLAKSC